MASPRTYTDRQAAEELQRNPGVIAGTGDSWVDTCRTVLYMASLSCGGIVPGTPDDLRERLSESLTANPFDRGIIQSATLDADRFRAFGGKAWASIWWWAKHHVVFIHHQKLLVSWLGAPDELQLLIRPDALLKMTQPKGDCAVFTTLICAMLDCAGLPWEIVTAAVDPRQPGIYSHVYPRVILSDGRRIPLDASHGKFPGWEVPAEHMSAKQIWNADGEPIEDAAPKFSGLHGVDMRYLYGGRDSRGLGQDDSDGGDDGTPDPIVTGGDSTIVPISSGSAGAAQGPDLPYGPNYCGIDGGLCSNPNGVPPAGTVTSSAAGGSTIAQDIAALLAGGNQIAKTATGQTVQPINSNTLLLFGGLAVAAILVISLLGKK